MQRDWFGPLTSGRGAYPPVNVFEHDGDYEIVAELPGVKKEDLDIQVKGATVRIHGKKSVQYADGASAHRRERVGGEFDRTLTLPALIDAAKVSADYRDGVLTLAAARREMSVRARSRSTKRVTEQRRRNMATQEVALQGKKELAPAQERTEAGKFYSPYTDIYETNDAVVVAMEVPASSARPSTSGSTRAC